MDKDENSTPLQLSCPNCEELILINMKFENKGTKYDPSEITNTKNILKSIIKHYSFFGVERCENCRKMIMVDMSVSSHNAKY